LGDHRSALRSFQAILACELGHSDALQYQGLIEYESGNIESGLTRLRQSMERDPGNDIAFGNLTLVLYDIGRPDEAYTACEQAPALSSRNVQARNILALIRERESTSFSGSSRTNRILRRLTSTLDRC